VGVLSRRCRHHADRLVEAGAAPGSRWIEEKHDELRVAMREFVGEPSAGHGQGIGLGQVIANDVSDPGA
jgi:hypothetical protein